MTTSATSNVENDVNVENQVTSNDAIKTETKPTKETCKVEASATNNESTTEKVDDVTDDKVVSDLESKILEQVEFYFSDSNLPRDKFLLGEMKNGGELGWVDISKIASFSRMKKLTEDVRVVAKALTKSSGLLQVNEEQTHVRRTSPIAEAKSIDARLVYVKGFPKESELEDLQKFFSQITPKVMSIRMQKKVVTKATPKSSSDDDGKKEAVVDETKAETETKDETTKAENTKAENIKDETTNAENTKTENTKAENTEDDDALKRVFKGSIFLECESEEEAKRVAALTDLKFRETDPSPLTLMTHAAFLESTAAAAATAPAKNNANKKGSKKRSVEKVTASEPEEPVTKKALIEEEDSASSKDIAEEESASSKDTVVVENTVPMENPEN